jgi:hypothetical protein
MTTITLPPEIEGPLAEEARKQGTTPELLAVGCLRKLFTPSPTVEKPAEAKTLFDFLSGYIGTVSGTTEALSENCGHALLRGSLRNSSEDACDPYRYWPPGCPCQ